MDSIDLSTIDYAIIFGYFAIVFLIPLFIKKKDNDIENYFLAGRRLTLPLFITTLVTTWYGNLLGVSEISYKHGIVNWFTQGFFWYIVYLFFALFLVNKIRKHKLFTIPDQLEKFYDKKTALAGAVVNLFMLTPAPYILSMGLIFHLIFSIDAKWGIIIGTVIPLFYTLKGGFKAVIYTDFIQFIFMFIGVAAIIPFAIAKYGGFSFVFENAPETHFQITGDWSPQLVLAWFLIALWTIVDSGFHQRVYAAKDNNVARNGILLATIFWFVFDLMITAIGIFAFAAMPGLEATTALPVFASSVLPVVLKGIFFTGLIATVMSTLDSLVFSSSMCLSHDIYRRISGVTDEKKIIKVNKIAIILIVSIALFISVFYSSIIELVYTRGSIGISALLIPILGAYYLKTNKPAAAFWSIIIATLVSVLCFIFRPFDIEPLYLGLMSSLLVFTIKR